MATEWGITTFLTTKDLKVRIPFRNTDGDYFSFWTERRADKYYDIKR